MKSELNSEIAKAFAGDLKDAVKPFTGERHTAGYQSEDDWLLNTPATNSILKYQGKGVFGSYKAIEIDGEAIRLNDVKLTCLQSQCGKAPALDDLINGMSVVSIGQDPTGVIWILQLRGVGK